MSGSIRTTYATDKLRELQRILAQEDATPEERAEAIEATEYNDAAWAEFMYYANSTEAED